MPKLPKSTLKITLKGASWSSLGASSRVLGVSRRIQGASSRALGVSMKKVEPWLKIVAQMARRIPPWDMDLIPFDWI